MKTNEEAVSKAQQALFGIALSVKRDERKLSEVPAEYKDEVKKIVDSMTEDEIRKFAATKTKDLPDRVSESLKEGDYVTFKQNNIHRYGQIISIDKGKNTAEVTYEFSGEDVTDDISLDKLEKLDISAWKKMNETKEYRRMPSIKELNESLKRSDIQKIADYINSLGLIATIPTDKDCIYVSTLIGPVAQTLIRDFVDNMGLKYHIQNDNLGSSVWIGESSEATPDSVPGRGEFSMGNNPQDAADNTKGSGEVFGNVKKKKTDEAGSFSLGELESYYFDNEDKIKNNLKAYGWDNKRVSEIRNYIDLANILGIDSRLLKDVDVAEYAGILSELLLSK